MKKFACVFPGQGSQSVGMLAQIADAHPIIQETFATASDVLGYDLWALTKAGPAEKLNQTEFTQPAVLTASYALWQLVFANAAEKPSYLAGHSLGEYTAWVCAGALPFESAVALVAKRGQAMQQAVPADHGAMAAIIGLEDAVVDSVCHDAAEGAVCSAANFNSIGQVVIAGEKQAVLRAIALAKASGAKLAKLIPVSVPSHCLLMEKAVKVMQPLLEDIAFSTPDIPVINNVDVTLPDTPEAIRDGLLRQLTQPVRWVATVQQLMALGVHDIIECGPGKVLTGLNKRIDQTLTLSLALDQITTC